MVIAAALLPILDVSTAAAQCPPLAFEPIPELRVHVGFPVDYRAELVPGAFCGVILFGVVSAPPEFSIDGAGGLFYWTPASAGTKTITLRAERLSSGQVATVTFQAIVDDNTMSYPLFRDYLSQATDVAITGRAHGTGFVSYVLEYADQATPSLRLPIAGPVTSPVTSGLLANWSIGALPDGGRYVLTLTVNYASGPPSVLTNLVIIDRSAKPGWPKRVGPITHSPTLADLDDDGRDEVIVATHFGELYVWDIDGHERFEYDAGFATYSAPAVGDIDGDGRPEIVWATTRGLYAHEADGTVMPGFPVPVRPGLEFRTPPALADLDGDGRLDVLVGTSTVTGRGRARVYAYDSRGERVRGWPRSVRSWSVFHSPSVGDLDGDGADEVVVQAHDRVYAWRRSGRAFRGLNRARLPIPVENGISNGGGGLFPAKPAIADLDGDGSVEVIVGPNVLELDGVPRQGWEAGAPGVRSALSAAVGDLDLDPGNGLEIALGCTAWRADRTPVRPPLDLPTHAFLFPAALGDCGLGDVCTLVGHGWVDNGVSAFRFDGSLVPGHPKSLYGYTGDTSAPVIGDFDDDGLVDTAATITDASYGGIVAVWELWALNHDEGHDWPTMGHDARQTGCYEPPPPNRPRALTAELVGGRVQLQWEDRSAVEDGYLVERSPTGAPFSFQTIASIPADSTSFDGQDTQLAHYRVRAVRTDPRTGRAILSRPSNRAPS